MVGLSWKAKIFIILTIAFGLGLSAYNLAQINWQNYWMLILAGVAAVAQVFKVEGATHKSSYNLSWMIYGFAFLLLGGSATLFIILVAHLIDWLWHKYPWYIQSFNMATFAITVSAASWVYNWLLITQLPHGFPTTLAAFVALTAFTLFNHLLIGIVIWFARGQNFTQSGVLGTLTLMIDFTLLGLGAIAGMLWGVNPSAIVFVIVPIYMIYSTLRVPNLQRQTEIDPKTNLYNARHFAEVLKKEYDRSLRYDRPLTVVIGDLDLLRNINNTYGHLAGDVVLVGVAEILQNNFRDYDLVARFGGEEFAILMPETTPEAALPRVEAVRQTIAAAEFEVPTSITPIKATISFGIAARNGEESAEELIHNADVTLYRSKLMGRNVTCVYTSDDIEGLFSKHDQDTTEDSEIPLESRLLPSQYISQLNPLREKTNGREESAAPPAPSSTKVTNSPPLWRLNGFIALLVSAAVTLAVLVMPFSPLPDWLGLFAFSLIVLLTEGLSIDLYINDTTISTSAAPLIAGALLFGPFGALVLSLVLAGTAMIKHRSQLHRLVFNIANHFLSTLLGTFMLLFVQEPFITLPGHTQIIFAIFSGNVIFFSSTFLLAGVIGISLDQQPRKIWLERFRWLWPYYIAFGVVAFTLILGYSFAGVLGVLAVLVPLLMLRFSHMQYINRTKEMVGQLREQNFELEDHSTRITTLNEEILLSLANVIDMRDSYTFGHSQRVSEYAVQIAEELQLSADKIDLIRTGSLLHDIGKIGIPDSILFKPSSLTGDEFEFIRRHPVRGVELVRSNKSLRGIVPLIRYHHERFDGQGYPDGLSGHEIPLEARILCLADAVQAMGSDRPYRKALNRREIIAEVDRQAGTQFDPQVVKAFFKIFDIKVFTPLKTSPQEQVSFEPVFRDA